MFPPHPLSPGERVRGRNSIDDPLRKGRVGVDEKKCLQSEPNQFVL
jgi:hypothetical protein